MKLLRVIGAAAAVALCSTGWANAETTTLRVASWAPPSHAMNAMVFQTWGKWVEEATHGHVKIKVEYPQVPPPNLPDLVVDGGADISWISHAYSAGRYTMEQCVDLPGMGANAEAGSVAYWRTYQKYLIKAGEHSDVVLLGLTTHGQGTLQLRKPIKSLSELKGMKIRVPGGIGNEIIKLLGAQGVGVPAPKVYETLAQGVADGVIMPIETKKSFKLYEVAPFTLIIPGGMYYNSFGFIMNKASFAKLSKEDQAALMSVSGEKLSRLAGQGWDKGDAEGYALIKEKHLPTVTANPEMTAEYFNITSQLETEWIAKAKAKGIDGAAALAYLRAEAKSYKKMN
ncbi:MAG: TRAP transporter substrate-binding protein [Candidatus Eiseniibacteriota bacterium]